MKSNKNNRKAQFGRIGVVSLMALGLSSQSLFAIDLWYLSGPNKDKKVESIIDSDKTEAVKWLSDLKVAEFVEKYAKEPLKFIEAIHETLKSKSDDAFKKDLEKAFTDLDKEKFGGETEKDAYLALIKRALKEELESDEFLDLVFASKSQLQDLNLTLSKPKKTKTESDKEEGDVGEQSEKDFQAFCDSIRERLGKKDEQVDTLKGELDKLRASIEEANKTRQDQDIAAREQFGQLANEILNAKAQLSDALERANQVDPNALARNQQEKDAADVLNGLLSGLVDDQNRRDAEEEVAPAQQNQFPFFPQNARVNPGNANQFNQPLPQANNMPFFPQTSSVGPQIPISYDLGVTSGRPELADAQEILSANEMRQPVAASLNPMASVQELIVAKSRVAADVKRTQVALQNAKDKAAQLDERLEELKEGGRAALSPAVKQRLAQLKQAVDTKQSYLNQQRQMLSMLSPDQRDQLNNTLMQAQMDLSNAEQQYNTFNSQVEVAVEQANGQIKALAKQRDQLNSASNKLQSQMSSLKEDETAVTQLINNQMQAQMQMMQQGVPNGSRPRSGGPRRSPIGGALSGANGNYALASPLIGEALGEFRI